MIGWGTDIGGSIRIPCHMNVLWGLKPSVSNPSTAGPAPEDADKLLQSARMSYRGVEVSIDGQNHVPSAVGPMARSLGALTAVTKLAVEAEPWARDPQLPPIPWREDAYRAFSTRPLVVGTILDDGVVKVHPPIERVFRDVVTKLKAAGHEVVEWDTSLNSRCIETMVG